MSPEHEIHQPLPEAALRVLRRIEAAKRPLLTSHIRLDGDALGSELALMHILKAMGRTPHVVNDSAIPQIYRFLPGIEDAATTPAALRRDYDLAVALDVPTWERARAVRKALPADLPIVSIDHHPAIERIGDPEWVDTAYSSVGEMIYSQAIAGRWPITPDAATCLYTAILTDTGRFTFPNTTASCLHAAGALVELGAQHILAAEKTYQETTPGLLSLRAEALGTIRMYASDRIAVMSITHDMMACNRVDPIDTQEMADYPRSITGVAVGVLLREMRKQGKVKVSLRSRYGIDVEPVARKFGGGGHHEAAGCEVPGDMETVGTWVVEELTRRLREQGMT